MSAKIYVASPHFSGLAAFDDQESADDYIAGDCKGNGTIVPASQVDPEVRAYFETPDGIPQGA